MGLNKSTGNMYGFVSHTFNIIKGLCEHNCSYCYCKRWGKQKAVRFDVKELKTDLGSGNFIFVGSSCDMFSKYLPREWVIKTLEHCIKYNENKYLFQSKNPERFHEFITWLAAINPILCTTIETNRWYPEMGNAPSIYSRTQAMRQLTGFKKFVTIEPIMNFDLEPMVKIIKSINPEQVNIGADSGNNNLQEPSYEKILQLSEELSKFTKIENKRNLGRLMK